VLALADELPAVAITFASLPHLAAPPAVDVAVPIVAALAASSKPPLAQPVVVAAEEPLAAAEVVEPLAAA